jgi:hypothetical protein
MDKHFIIFIATILIFTLSSYFFIETFPYGNYVRSETMGRLLPRERDRDIAIYNYLNGNNDRKDDESNDKEVVYIATEADASNYIFDDSQHFPYGGFIYNRSYPVYLAKNLCPDDAPYWNTLDGTCIAVNSTGEITTPSAKFIEYGQTPSKTKINI